MAENLLYLALWLAFGGWVAAQWFLRARPGAPC
jgi:hypothetical protein